MMYLRLEEGGVEVGRGAGHGGQVHGGVGGVGECDGERVRRRQRRAPELQRRRRQRQRARRHRAPAASRSLCARLLAPFLSTYTSSLNLHINNY